MESIVVRYLMQKLRINNSSSAATGIILDLVCLKFPLHIGMGLLKFDELGSKTCPSFQLARNPQEA